MTALKKRFNVGAEKEPIERVFNIKVQHFTDGRIKLSQEQYILSLANIYNVEKDERVESPMTIGYQCDIKDELNEKDIEQMRVRPYNSLLSAGRAQVPHRLP